MSLSLFLIKNKWKVATLFLATSGVILIAAKGFLLDKITRRNVWFEEIPGEEDDELQEGEWEKEKIEDLEELPKVDKQKNLAVGCSTFTISKDNYNGLDMHVSIANLYVRDKDKGVSFESKITKDVNSDAKLYEILKSYTLSEDKIRWKLSDSLKKTETKPDLDLNKLSIQKKSLENLGNKKNFRKFSWVWQEGAEDKPGTSSVFGEMDSWGADLNPNLKDAFKNKMSEVYSTNFGNRKGAWRPMKVNCNSMFEGRP